MKFHNLLKKNCVTGCLCIMNRSVYKNLGEYSVEIPFHDWWAALYASAFGVLYRIPKVLMLYRQHGNNYAGIKAMLPEDSGQNRESKPFLQRLWIIIKTPLKKFRAGRASCRIFFKDITAQPLLFRSRYGGGEMPDEVSESLENICALAAKNRFIRLRAFIRGKYLKGNWLDKLEQIVYVLCV